MQNFHHARFVVSNPRQAADCACIQYGFSLSATAQLKGGGRSYMVQQKNIRFVYESPLHTADFPANSLVQHGDHVADIAFSVDNIDYIVKEAQGRMTVVDGPHCKSDQHGTVRTVTLVSAAGGIKHTLIEDCGYTGPFLPGYTVCRPTKSNGFTKLPSPNLQLIDHAVSAQPETALEDTEEWYRRMLQLRRFWTTDDTRVSTDYSALRTVVVANKSRSVQISVVEPASHGSRRGKSQIEEFIDYNNGAGVQHIALSSEDILASVRALRARGVEFLPVPQTYYEDLRSRLRNAAVDVVEDLDEIERLQILVDFDEMGYLLQLFTRPVQDRPTFFLEIIQRHNHQGFGAGNFKALFEAVEREQKLRGNL